MSSFESFGKYVLLEKLATGGMAEVFLARGTGAGGIGKFFAIKRILPQYADSPEFIDMFKDEAKIAINLNHSNIVSIHEFGVEKGQFFLVMDYVEGRNLRQILNKMKKSALQFSVDQIVYCIKEVAGGLDHAHRCIDGSTGKPLNITHRDMSPQNLMVSFEGEVKIVDFGIAKAESQLETTRAGTLKGKFGYMSPEQAEGQPVDLRTDIFSLGIVMWELLANDRLFVANNEINTLRKIRDCQIPSLRKINPNIHTELERIVHKALARDRNLRYQTGAALHRDLNRFLNRQYPDFSPQDFAVFIKSVFADEILSLRKRLVEYSRVNLANKAKAEQAVNDNTSLLENNTSSLVVSESGHDRRPAFETGPVSQSQSRSMPTPPPAPTRQEDEVGHDGIPENSLLMATSVGRDNSMISSRVTTSSHDLPPSVTGRSGAPLLNAEALEAEAQQTAVANRRAAAIETEEISTQDYDRNENVTRNYRGHASGASVGRERPIRLATFIVFTMLCVSVYAYLVKYFTATMLPVIAITDPVLHPFYAVLGVDKEDELTSHKGQGATNINPGTATSASNAPNTPSPAPNQNPALPGHAPGDNVAPTAPTAPPTANGNPNVSAAMETAAPDTLDSGPSALVVTSNPSGAEVLIDEKSTGLFTPIRLDVPKGKFSITIRKRGYVDYKQREVTKETFGHHFTANLIKMNVAYVDIDVIPPQGAKVFINGRPISTQKGPIREYPVSANTPIKIRAENRSGTAYEEITVNLQVDRRQTVQLNPHTPLRLPSNSPNE